MNLFDRVVPEKDWHPNFRSMILNRNEFDMDVLLDWANGFVDRDGNFIREFQTTFNSRFWELYLYAVLKYLRLNVDFSSAIPDFTINQPPFCIEAVTSAQAAGNPPEHLTYSAPIPEDLNVFNLGSILRQANSINAKSKKYLDSYCNHQHIADRPFVVALAPFDCPYFMIEAHRPIEAVLFGYYIDEERRIAGKVASLDEAKVYLSAVQKENGAKVPVGIFNNESHKHISAVIYSTLATKGKVRALSGDPSNNSVFTALKYNPDGELPLQEKFQKNDYKEGLLDGLHVYHNPFAEKPLYREIFDKNGVNQVYFNHDSGEWIQSMMRGFLFFRNVLTLIER